MTTSMFSDVPKDILTQLLPYIASHEMLDIQIATEIVVGFPSPCLIIVYPNEELKIYCKRLYKSEKTRLLAVKNKIDGSIFQFSGSCFMKYTEGMYKIMMTSDDWDTVRVLKIPKRLEIKLDNEFFDYVRICMDNIGR
jgi:hypothetical protein